MYKRQVQDGFAGVVFIEKRAGDPADALTQREDILGGVMLANDFQIAVSEIFEAGDDA